MIQRRSLLQGAAAATISVLAAPALGNTRQPDKRFIFILQRGAVDGLSLVAPIGDPAFVRQRGILAEEFADAAPIGAGFALHPTLSNLATLYAKGELLVHHAIASNYRARSHFDAQNVLECGGTRPNEYRSGWLNRALALPALTSAKALALASSIPLTLRGAEPVSSYAPSLVPVANDDLMQRVSGLYSDDEQLGPIWKSALETRGMIDDDGTTNLRNAQKVGQLAAQLMRGQDGARILMIELDGWDSHAGQINQLGRMFGNFDAMIGALKLNLGKEWADTLIVAATEFGRTVRPNPSFGTDHGTASAALLMGGGVHGGRVLGDWPGLANNQLYEGRDLRPTASLEALLAGAVSDHFGMVPSAAAERMFPGRQVRPIADLLKSSG